MITIHKYEIPIEDSFVLELPVGARILSVQTQNGVPQLWAVVDSRAPKREQQFHLRGTGYDCQGLGSLTYLATFQIHDGALVFHLFT